jgi:amino acid adenylation domain-containing protein
VYEDRTLTYSELNASANQVARLLRKRGVGPDLLVALSVERGLEMLVGVIGILKAGGAYVPLDPNYPAERLTYMLKDTAAKVVLTQERLKDKLPVLDAEVITLDSDWHEFAEQPDTNLDHAAVGLHPSNLAYVIYTSGSTGHPKGVMVEHQNVTRLFSRTDEWFNFNRRDVWTLFHSIAFDFSLWEIWGAFLYGGRLVVVPQLITRSPKDFYRLVCNLGITVLNQTPSAFAQLIDAQATDSERMHSLRLIVLGGEALETKKLLPWIRRNGLESPQLVNMYGITETTVHVTYQLISAEDIDSDWRSPIGNAIPDLQVYLLDRYRDLVARGVTGEIYVGGGGVARGYLNRPDLTAERFVANIFEPESRIRLYKTGDLARWNSSGKLEYVGRNDQQVKVRGYRIELGEIKSQLMDHPEVKDAAIVAREVFAGERRIIAYIVGDRSGGIEVECSDVSNPIRSDIVGDWQALYEQTYSERMKSVGPSFVGWNSSFTGQPIPDAHMQEWLSSTVDRILELKPDRLLEIGCGVGLLLQHLAPRCEVYVGTDISTVALSQLDLWMRDRADLKHVQLLHRGGADLRDIEPATFDTVVINSVAQYFPNVEYLLEVVQAAIRLLRPGGKVFLGDIRHLGLLSTFHSAVQLEKAPSTATTRQLRDRIAQSISQEKELVIDPRFFLALIDHVPEINDASVQIKRGLASNELTRYRYDVVLFTSPKSEDVQASETLDWETSVRSLEGFEAALREKRWQAIRLTSAPNGRLAGDVATHGLIEASDNRLDAGELRRRADNPSIQRFSPEMFWRLGDAYGYDVRVTWGSSVRYDSLDVTVRSRLESGNAATRVPQPSSPAMPWRAYTNDPSESVFRQQLVLRLRDYLKDRLPQHMLPSGWFVLRSLPLTPNGKLDLRALPLPYSRPDELGQYVPPRGGIESAVADIWTQVLRIERVGRSDNFFDLGGHSLLAARVISRVCEQFNVEVSLREVFDAPTVEQLSARVRALRKEQITEEDHRVRDLGQEFREEIDAMQEDEVLARIAELETELGLFATKTDP